MLKSFVIVKLQICYLKWGLKHFSSSVNGLIKHMETYYRDPLSSMLSSFLPWTDTETYWTYPRKNRKLTVIQKTPLDNPSCSQLPHDSCYPDRGSYRTRQESASFPQNHILQKHSFNVQIRFRQLNARSIPKALGLDIVILSQIQPLPIEKNHVTIL